MPAEHAASGYRSADSNMQQQFTTVLIMISLCNTFIQCTHFILKCSWCKMKCVDVPSVLSASIKRVYFMGFLKPLAYNAISCLSTYHEKYAYAKVSKELEHTCC